MKYECQKCGQQWYVTYDIVPACKRRLEGRFREKYATKARSDERLSYECIERIYDEMFGAEDFNNLNNNCKHWCAKFWAKLFLEAVIFGFLSNANE